MKTKTLLLSNSEIYDCGSEGKNPKITEVNASPEVILS